MCDAIPPRALVADYHVSAARQGASGLALDVQREMVRRIFADGGSQLVEEFTEVTSRRRADRPEPARATQDCRNYGATLVLAKLDRLSQDAYFLLRLEKAGVKFPAPT